MGDKTGIAWTDATWNPVRGCSRVSPGCENCYAERQAIRMSGPGGAYEGLVRLGKNGPRWTGEVRLAHTPRALRDTASGAQSPLTLPLRWRKHRRIFVNSMSDLFHEKLDFSNIDRVFAVMAISAMYPSGAAHMSRHTFQILTKRSKRMREYLSAPVDKLRRRIADAGAYLMEDGDRWHDALRFDMPWPLPNVWMGVSAEDQQRANERVPDLLETPAAIRFVSYEPALGPIDFNECEWLCEMWRKGITIGTYLDWVIVGGESGPKARPFDVQWARDVVRQCKETKTACFVKQMGSRPVGRFPELVDTGLRVLRRFRDKKGADPDEWPEDLRVREFPQ